ncbi:ATP-dependent helicase [Arthrobacter castelli]|uniref:ATP-dependent helicase n=1 Tax=Arthrobacter castelli TaxID=271431 RepID=UPI0006851720|nr:ATP-dependent DNA helicase [Arthrobacter castelli]
MLDLDGTGEQERFTPQQLASALGQHQPTEEQAAIISAPLEPLLVVAGAGSGKTATMADRVVWLVANGKVRPEEILGVTFTRKAAGELADRMRTQLANLSLKGLLPADVTSPSEADAGLLDPKVSTYHSYASSLVTDHGLRLGIERDSVLLGGAQSWQMASQVVEAYSGEFEHFTAAKSTLVQAVIQLAGECSEHLQHPGEVRTYLLQEAARMENLPYLEGKTKEPAAEARKIVDRLRTRATVAELVERYTGLKRERGALDFGDLVALAAKIADEVPAAGHMERQRFKVVLLDEFQDTSHAQMQLFSRLFGGGHPVTAVGDPNQSIYGFRGASAGQLFSFPTTFPLMDASGSGSAAPVKYLSIAWRNSVNVLSMANTISRPLNAVAPNRPGSARIEVPDLRSAPAAGAGKVILGRFETDADEAAAVVRRVEQYRATAFTRDEKTGRAVPTSAAVLCRRRAQMEPIRKQLEERAVPYEIVGLGGLLSTPEIVDLVATLRVLADPSRSDSLMRLLTGARWRVGPADLMAFSDWSKFLARQREKAFANPQEAGRQDESEAPVVEHDQVDSASLVEALDWLPRDGWTSGHGRSLSPEGLGRLHRLRQELNNLRTFIGDDLTTLLSEVERTMLLDIEVAAIPGVSIHYARRHLDAFHDAAAGYIQTAQRMDLLAFLSWLDAAAEEENGLDIPQVEVRRDAVQLLTVHASKGLEWDAVFVPGLNAATFPSDKDSRWSSGNSALPWPLRGDCAGLPVWDCDQRDQKGWVDSEKAFKGEVAHHTEMEERRLAYVAYTRAKHVLMCTSAAWNGSRGSVAGVSTFLEEVLPLAGGTEPAAAIELWADEDEVSTFNPMTVDLERAVWPYDPLEGPVGPDGPIRKRPGRRAQMERAARNVHAAAEGLSADSDGAPAADAGATPSSAGDGPAHPIDRASARWDTETSLLLERHNAPNHRLDVELPQHISASTLVDLADNPAEVVRQLRRPVPRKPGMAARQGTAFHTWVEEYFGTTGMLEFEQPRTADSFIDENYDLDSMTATFKESEWARRSPAAIEVPVETQVEAVVVRGRIDAVFQDRDGTWDLVDWKTGAVPSASQLGIRGVQLAVYRLAWARLKDVPLDRVNAAFYYVKENKVVRPHDMAGEEELESVIRSAYG